MDHDYCPGGIEAGIVAETLSTTEEHIEKLCEAGIIPDAHECLDDWLVSESVFQSLVSLKLAHEAIDLLHKAREMLNMASGLDGLAILKDDEQLDWFEIMMQNLERVEKEFRAAIRENPIEENKRIGEPL